MPTDDQDVLATARRLIQDHEFYFTNRTDDQRILDTILVARAYERAVEYAEIARSRTMLLNHGCDDYALQDEIMESLERILGPLPGDVVQQAPSKTDITPSPGLPKPAEWAQGEVAPRFRYLIPPRQTPLKPEAPDPPGGDWDMVPDSIDPPFRPRDTVRVTLRKRGRLQPPEAEDAP